jgi:hypothetical protein
MILNGRIGQVLGPFDTTDLLSKDGKISQFTPETSHPILTKMGVQTAPGTIIKVNNVEIKIGKTGIYELDEVVNVKSLIFPYGADADTIVDFVY